MIVGTVNLQSKYGRTVPTEFGENFDILPVGEDIILPPFIKKALCFARTTAWQAASFLRKHCGRPYRRCVVLSLLIVGDGVLDVPFIKISLRFARVAEDVNPYGFNCCPNICL